jgi:hypothetical protein
MSLYEAGKSNGYLPTGKEDSDQVEDLGDEFEDDEEDGVNEVDDDLGDEY